MATRGRLAFETEEALQEAVEAYFEATEHRTRKVITKDGNIDDIDDPRPATMSGLAVALGIDRRTLINYGYREEFAHVIAKARARVEAAHEDQLFTKDGARGASFSLNCNFGWKPTEKRELTGADGEPIKMTFAEEIAARGTRLGSRPAEPDDTED